MLARAGVLPRALAEFCCEAAGQDGHAVGVAVVAGGGRLPGAPGPKCTLAQPESLLPPTVAPGSTSAYHDRMTDQAGREITQRELRNDSGAIMRAVERGESFTISRNGTPIGRLIPLRRRIFVPREEVMAAFASAPVVDAEKFRSDIDSIANQDPFGRDW